MDVDKQERLREIEQKMRQLDQRMRTILSLKIHDFKHIAALLAQQTPQRRMELLSQRIEKAARGFEHVIRMKFYKKESLLPKLFQSFDNAIAKAIEAKEHRLALLEQRLQTALESKKLPPASAQVIKEQKPVGLGEVKVGDRVRLQDMDWEVEVEIVSKKPL